MAPAPQPWWELQRAARASLPDFLADYVDGGAGSGQAIDRNQRDLAMIELVPRPLAAAGIADPALSLLGENWAMPVAIAPTGLNDLIHPHGDLLLARAAQAAGLPFIQSAASLTAAPALAGLDADAGWQQLYIHDRHAIPQLAADYAAAGTRVLIVSVDVPTGGVRWHERRLPPALRPSWRTAAAAIRCPRWLGRHLWARALRRTQYQRALPQAFVDRQFDVNLGWDDLARLRNCWPQRLLIKGILHPDDACRARDIGFDGAIVSIHGGRQLECASSAWTMLPAIRSAVGNAFPLLADGGVRTGEDVIKALTTGASAVLVGRLPVWALAAGGADLLDVTLADLSGQIAIAMQLCGCHSLADIGCLNGAQQLNEPQL